MKSIIIILINNNLYHLSILIVFIKTFPYSIPTSKNQ